MEKNWIIILLMAFFCPAHAQWALPHISVAHVRTEPRHGAEMSTQALMGTPLHVDSVTTTGWVAITMPDGYTGYIIGNSLTMLDDEEFGDWRESERGMIVSSHEIRTYIDSLSYEPVSDLVAGDIVCLSGKKGRLRTEISLPDGRRAWVFNTDIIPLDSVTFTGVEPILDMARQQMGVPYLWGGLSTKGMDCSGLVKLAFLSAGYIVPRDASQQALAGVAVDMDSLQRGDLVFYGKPETGRINHVAIYDGDGTVIESAGLVRRNRVEDAGKIITARRLHVASTPVVTRHPWYYSRNVE